MSQEKILPQSFYEAMKPLESRYPTKVALLIPALHEAQKSWGWLPPEAMDEIARYIEIHPAQVREVASFYTMFNLKPVGKHHLKFCTNVACALRGAENLVSHCEKKLGIHCGETTEDMKFTLAEEECLGSCGTAPVLFLGDRYYEKMDVRQLDELMETLNKS